jgi:hypothetical protein
MSEQSWSKLSKYPGYGADCLGTFGARSISDSQAFRPTNIARQASIFPEIFTGKNLVWRTVLCLLGRFLNNERALRMCNKTTFEQLLLFFHFSDLIP